MRRIPLAIEVPQVIRMLMYTLLGLLLGVSAFFFVKASGTAEKGYQLRENQTLRKELESENRILKQHVLDAQSISALKESETIKEFREPEKTLVIPPKGPLTKKN